MAVIKVTQDNFNEEVLNSERTVLVDFNAGWCGPCKLLGPIVEELSEERKDVKFVSIDIDEEDILAEDNDVTSIPCLVVFRNGKEVARSVGFKPKDAVAELIGG
ncbi:MAG: thioredoxin [Ruminococcus sp.]|nr:thioredoxin [Ruminococcus sp.]